jgi:uncharacterized protein DUF2846
MRFTIISCFTVLILAASGCATGPFSGGTGQALPALEAGKGRVLIYRSSAMGSPYVPDVLLNGERVGRLDRPGVIFRDVPPGSYAVTSTNISRVVNFSVAAGDRKYIRFANGFFEQYLHPEMVESASGESEAAGLRIVVQGQK